MKKCAKCGFEMSENDSICPNCGNDNTVSPKQPGLNTVQPKRKSGSGKTITIICIVLGILIATVAGCFIFFVFNRKGSDVPEPEERVYKFGTLTMNEVYFASGEENTVLFTVEVEGKPDEVILYRDKKEIAKMNDKGIDGDVTANDNIYSCNANICVEADKLTTFDYYCKAKDSKYQSAAVESYCFPRINEASAADAYEVQNTLKQEIKDLEDNYIDENGIVPENEYEALFNDITALLDIYVKDGKVLHYMWENDTVFVKFTSGLGSLYAPKKDGYDNVSQNVNMMVLTCQPCFTDMGGETFPTSGVLPFALPTDVDYLLEMLDKSGEDVASTFPNYSFRTSQNFDDSQVSLNAIKSFKSNQLILWHGHGYYGPIVKSCLVTGEPFDAHAWWFDAEYFMDCVSNRIINSLIVGYDNVIISSGFIDRYCGEMSNSLVYLAACDSGRTPELANAFTNKGAVVVANTDTILRVYNVAMLYETIANLQKVDFDTNEYYTLSRALQEAKNTYGADDSVYGGNGATPVIFGGSVADDYRLSDELWLGTLAGKVCMASDRVTGIENATVDVYIGSELYKTTYTDVSGNYSVDLPGHEYTVKITCDGFIDFVSYETIETGYVAYRETYLLVVGDVNDVGVATGYVYNSLSGTGCSGINISFKKNWNNPYDETIATVTTDNNGFYSVELPLGNYTAVVSREGYSTSSFNIVVQNGSTDNQNGMITPEINGDSYLITLTWGANPSDLDSHMVGVDGNGRDFHVYYANKVHNNYEEVCNLDYDDTTSYGPEHITVNVQGDKPYYYYVYRYSGSGTVAGSGAKVTVEQGNVLVAEFHVPANLGTGDYWNIFAIRDGELVVQNTITSSADISYADGFDV